MRTLFVPVTVLLLAVCGTVAVGDEVKSGLKPGEFPGAFHVLDVSGPAKGETLCYRCSFGNRPVVSIFANKIDKKLTSLIKEIDKKLAKEKRIKAFFVLMSDDLKADEAKLAKFAKKNNIKNIPLTIFDGVDGPKSYKLSKKAEVTVVMWSESNVKVNHAFAKDKLDKKAIKKILDDTSKLLK